MRRTVRLSRKNNLTSSRISLINRVSNESIKRGKLISLTYCLFAVAAGKLPVEAKKNKILEKIRDL